MNAGLVSQRRRNWSLHLFALLRKDVCEEGHLLVTDCTKARTALNSRLYQPPILFLCQAFALKYNENLQNDYNPMRKQGRQPSSWQNENLWGLILCSLPTCILWEEVLFSHRDASFFHCITSLSEAFKGPPLRCLLDSMPKFTSQSPCDFSGCYISASSRNSWQQGQFSNEMDCRGKW